MVGTDLISQLAPSAIAYKVLEPSANVIGDHLASFTQRRIENLRNINESLEHKFGVDELTTPGEIAPRVIRGLLEEGSYMEDDVGAEYFAGVVAGSRSEDGSDDSGVALIEVMNSLSSVQLRTHYSLYSATQRAIADRNDIDLRQGERGWARVAVPTEQLLRAVFGDDPAKWTDDIGPIMRGLKRADLIEPNWAAGPPDGLRKMERMVAWRQPSVVFTATNFGIELYCAAHGFTSIDDFKRGPDEFAGRFQAKISPCEANVVAELPPFEPTLES
jgi:hypothetical protein